MTVEEAGEFYLNAVCPANVAALALSDEVNAAVNAGTGQNMPVVREKAAVSRDLLRDAVDRITDETTVWPEVVAADIEEWADAKYTDISTLGQMADAPDEATFSGPWNVWTDPAIQAQTSGLPQKVRAKLELPSDGMASCEGR